MFDIELLRRGWGFIILNIIRACNMAVLTTIAIASIVFMIVAGLPNAWIFFSDVFLACIVCMCGFLALSETQYFGTWMNRHWPAFGPRRGFSWLGYSMIIMASHLLGKLSDERFSQKKMGPVFWNVCVAAGILGYIFGLVNLFSTWWFGVRLDRYVRVYRATGVTEGREDPKTGLPRVNKSDKQSFSDTESMKGSLPIYAPNVYLPGQHSMPPSIAPTRQSSTRGPTPSPYGHPQAPPLGFGGRGAPGAGKSNDDDISSCSDGDDRATALDDNVSQFSVPSRQQQMSPIAPGLLRPDSSLHPAHRRHPSNTYSVASHFTGWGRGI
ncbi:hypothetical protein PFICI_15022 [Pestalotiopsis fici W106-1]|uniref:DUF7598 domain-containing protein n=1 Tax=Pestalotiopsis fici (strain W106-1 / CGMCC3.15140) TaxID=1229662 RepID=W3WJU5_PESFW|nr:uncharacterized protein PFICI_15022 [Pestalotiopsis fici W106-1]ETS73417.1 hypothetical protein PFICI_15022 [Pestalotiopsis fici W106-1]